MATESRILQVNNLLQEVLNEILLREHEFPQDVIATITHVESTPNLQQAKVYISVIPEEKEPEALRTLNRNVYHTQQVLNKKLAMRPVPRIEWVSDKGAVQAQHVRNLLDKIQQEKEGKE